MKLKKFLASTINPIILKCLLTSLLVPVTTVAQVTITEKSSVVNANEAYELTITDPHVYANNWEDVQVSAIISGNKQYIIDGFYFDTFTWKVRFAPPEAGEYTYTVNFNASTGKHTFSGKFRVVPSEQKGFLTVHPTNPFRLIFPDGTLFNSIGLEDCSLDVNRTGSPLDDFGFDGLLRTGGAYTGSDTTLDVYMKAYGVYGAGFNLYRWTTDNCSFRLYDKLSPDGNVYLLKEGMYGDTLVRSLQANKIRIWLTFFGPPVFANLSAADTGQEAALKKYIKYIVARYGAYVDIWELFNENSASDYYYQVVASYLKSIDPFHRLISVSDERPKQPTIDINSPHWYERESEFQSDTRAWEMITDRKVYKKPIMFGEQGNSIQCWDPLSALRMRIRSWTSFFAEGTLIFWNTSFAKDFQHPKSANIYLGPEERRYIRAMQDFTALADSSTVQSRFTILNPGEVRGYGLASKTMEFGYFHHYSSHETNVPVKFKMRLKRPGTVYWVDPATNTIVGIDKLQFGTQTIESPAFNVDLGMRIEFDTSSGAFNESNKLDVLVYPNPASTAILLSGNFNSEGSITIFNISGQQVFTAQHVKNEERISIGAFPQGLYVYVFTASGRKASGKLIIQR